MKKKLIGILVCLLLVSIVLPISGSTGINFQPILEDTKVHLLPCADVYISIVKPDYYEYKLFIKNPKEEGYGIYRSIKVINGEASLIAAYCPSINKCYFGYNYENNETVSLNIPLFFGLIEYLEDYGPKIRIWGYAILPKLTVEV